MEGFRMLRTGLKAQLKLASTQLFDRVSFESKYFFEGRIL